MNRNPKVSVVLLNWNTEKDTIECILSLKQTGYENLEIIVVDNGSQNSSPDIIEERFKSEIILIRNKKNLGFSGGNNIGILKALENKADYIFILNNDTIVDKDIIENLVDFMQENPKAGIVAPIMFFYHKKDYIWFAGGIMDEDTGIGEHIGYEERFGEDYNKIIECDFITGCGMFFRSEVFRKVGLFDTDYFHTSEDADICIRVKNKGYKLYLNPKAKLWHKCAASLRDKEFKQESYPPYYIYYEVRNRLLYMKKNSRIYNILKSLPKIIYFHLYEIYQLLKKKEYNSIIYFLYGIWDFAWGRFGEKKFKKV